MPEGACGGGGENGGGKPGGYWKAEGGMKGGCTPASDAEGPTEEGGGGTWPGRDGEG